MQRYFADTFVVGETVADVENDTPWGADVTVDVGCLDLKKLAAGIVNPRRCCKRLQTSLCVVHCILRGVEECVDVDVAQS